MRSLLVVVLSLSALAAPARAQTIDRQALTMLTEVITVELSKNRRLAVISSTDVREVVALEAEKQASPSSPAASSSPGAWGWPRSASSSGASDDALLVRGAPRLAAPLALLRERLCLRALPRREGV